MCTACSLYNQCSTFMEAAVSLIDKEAGDLGYMLSPDGGEVSVLAWADRFLSLTMFDALAPFHPTALGILTNLPKIEQADDTMRKKSFLHAWCSLLGALFPKSENLCRAAMLMNLGLQGLDNVNSTDMSTPEGIGNFVGDSIATFAKKDGMNAMGDMNGKKYNLKTFSDYTGYSPVNSVNHVSNPRLWQPDVVKSGPIGGKFSSQMFATPQLALVKPFSVSSVERYRVSPPGRLGSWEQYRRDTDEVIASLAGLTAEKKAMSEYFNDKLMIVHSLLHNVLLKRGHDFYILNLKLTLATSDALVAVWKEKTRYNMVRPFTAVRYLYANHTLAAYSKAAGKVVDDMSGRDWDSFIPTADHPEHPSATAAYCGAVAELMRLETGSDDTDRFEWIVSKNSSFQEEAQPPEDITLAFPTWTDWETQCGLSRVWAGTHFVDAVTEGRALGRQFAKTAQDFVDFHVNG